MNIPSNRRVKNIKVVNNSIGNVNFGIYNTWSKYFRNNELLSIAIIIIDNSKIEKNINTLSY